MYSAAEIEEKVRQEFGNMGMSEDLKSKTKVLHIYSSYDPKTLQVRVTAEQATHQDIVTVSVQLRGDILVWAVMWLRISRSTGHCLHALQFLDSTLTPHRRFEYLLETAGVQAAYRLMQVTKGEN